MYKAFTSGSTTGKSGTRYEWNAGDDIPEAPKGELEHVKGVEWFEEDEEEQEPANEPETEDENPLPPDLPGRDDFFDAGVESVDEIREMEDPTEVNGIGPKTAKDLAEWFAEQDN